MMAQAPTEFSLGWAYIPPILVDALIGFICALVIVTLLNKSGLSRYFVNPPLAFVAFWVLSTSLIGIFLLPP
jgi:hypothetical protein